MIIIEIQKEWKISLPIIQNKKNIIGEILEARGIKNQRRFLNPIKEDLLPFETLKNIEESAKVILNGIRTNKTFGILADVDNDGCAACAIMYRYLSEYTDNLKWFINKGKIHGLAGQEPENFQGIDILIIVDSSSENYDQHKILKDMGIQVLIFDHHGFLKYPEDAILVSSAKNYANPALSGAGVTWKVCAYLDSIVGQEYAEDLLDLCASGIIGDVCAVDESSYENRYLCHKGFESIKNLALKTIIGDYTFNSQSVSYSIAPLINAANRSNKNEMAIKLFLSDDEEEVIQLISELKKYKEEQDAEVNKLIKELQSQIDKIDLDKSKVIIGFINAGNYSGVLAGKLASEYSRPCIILHDDPDSENYKGSMRSVGVENFRDIINGTKLAWSGGHESAAGVKISKTNYPKFIEVLNKVLLKYKFKITQEADVILQGKDITVKLAEEVNKINKISGAGFQPIRIIIEDIIPITTITMQDKHSKFSDGRIDYIMWNSTDVYKKLQPEEECTVICSILGIPQINYFRGKKHPQLIISDIKITQMPNFLLEG